MNPIVRNILRELDKLILLSAEDAILIIYKVTDKTISEITKEKNETEPT